MNKAYVLPDAEISLALGDLAVPEPSIAVMLSPATQLLASVQLKAGETG